MRISDWSSDVCSSDLPGGEWLRVLLDLRFHRPVFARHERADLQLPFADQPQRRRLHATGGQARLHLAPQQRRQIEADQRSEEHTSELQSLMRISYAVFCLKKKNTPLNPSIPQYYYSKQRLKYNHIT